MKLKYSTKLFIVVNLIIIALRTSQIMFLTEDHTAFLKNGYLAINIMVMLILISLLAALFWITYNAVRQPLEVNFKGIPSCVAAGVSALLYVICFADTISSKPYGWVVMSLLSVLSALALIILAISAIKDYKLVKFVAFPLIAYWAVEFVFTYLFYTERPLRVRTVYEIFAICFVILFLIIFGKVTGGVNTKKNFRLMYPIGLLAGSLCLASVVPEMIASIFGYSDKVAESAVMPVILISAAIFTIFFTINTFKKNNTVRPNHYDI